MKNKNIPFRWAVLLIICILLSNNATAQIGALDPTFDSDGIVVTTTVPAYNGLGFDIALQADGKIVVSGCFSLVADNDFELVRYNSDGSLDATFDSDGMVLRSFLGRAV